jgi:hypothetical protein
MSGKLPVLGIPNLDDNDATDCFSGCPINAVVSLFLR